MSRSHEILAAALDLSNTQYLSFLELWQKAGYFEGKHLSMVFNEFIKIPQAIKSEMCKIGDDYHKDNIDANSFMTRFLGEKEYAVELLALAQYFSQSWFGGAEAKEIYLISSTKFIEDNKEALLAAADQLQLYHAQNQLIDNKIKADVGLFIGATSVTTRHYVSKIQEIIDKVEHPYILLGNRLLTAGTNDKPQKASEAFPYEGEGTYVDFLTTYFGDLAESDLREGHVMLHQLSLRFPEKFPREVRGQLAKAILEPNLRVKMLSGMQFVTGTKDSPVFFDHALKDAAKNNIVNSTSKKNIVVNGIAPHLVGMISKVDVACSENNILANVYAHGDNATPNAIRVPRALAVIIDMRYQKAAHYLKNIAQIKQAALDPKPLTWSVRKATQKGRVASDFFAQIKEGGSEKSSGYKLPSPPTK